MKILRNIDVTLVSLLLNLKRFHVFSFISFLNFKKCSWLSLPAEIKVQTSEIIKHAKTDANYAVLTKQVKLQH